MSIHKKNIGEKLKWGENSIALIIVAAMTLLPEIETIARIFKTNGLPASQVIVQHMTLWVGFIGAVLASRQNKLLALTYKPLFNVDETFSIPRFIAKTVSFIVIITLAWGSFQLIKVEYQYPFEIAPNIERWVAQIIMPIGFFLIGYQIFQKSFNKKRHQLSVIIILIIFLFFALTDSISEPTPFVWIGLVLILLSLFYGAPIFIGLGGTAALMFWADSTPVSAIPTETYRIVISPTLPTIPLFTTAGYLLAESNASERLVKVFRSLFGWVPGGTPVIIVVLSGFFTALTGGSGVTILALGGLLLPMLLKEGYSRNFSLGLITVAGSIGLLFPPSLPAIIYGVTAGVSVKDVFLGGLIPGLLLVVLISGWAIYQGKIQHVKHYQFNLNDAIRHSWEARWELILPFFILFGVFGGFATLVETAALSVIYVFIIETYVYKDLAWNDIPRIILESATLIGGVIMILGVAMGLTSYLVDAQIPILLLSWVKGAIASKYFFLILLNIFLLLVGCLMDIFSAIIVIVPLIAPLGAYFGIDPVHLAVIFIANLELGFLTPPVGMNLFLAAYRFDENMPTIYLATLPFFIVRLIAVLLITYVPLLTLGLLL